MKSRVGAMPEAALISLALLPSSGKMQPGAATMPSAASWFTGFRP